MMNELSEVILTEQLSEAYKAANAIPGILKLLPGKDGTVQIVTTGVDKEIIITLTPTQVRTLLFALNNIIWNSSGTNDE